MEVITQRQLRNDSGEVLRRVEAGETFTVTRRGVPVADLVPHQQRQATPTRYVAADVLAADLADLPPWDAGAFEHEQAELDTRVDDAPRDPWQAR
jgi:prevent-host-death family protein